MKITMYELLGMVKDGKAPKKICFLNHYYIWKENDEDYQKEDGLMLFGNSKINYILNTEVEILEEEKKIPEKFKVHSLGDKDEYGNFVSSPFPTNEEFMNKINEIIDYLKSKGE